MRLGRLHLGERPWYPHEPYTMQSSSQRPFLASKDIMESNTLQPYTVDLATVPPHALDRLWHYEAQWWQETFLWGIAASLEALRRVVERRGVPGQVVYVGTQAVGYVYYVVTGTLGTLSGLVVLPEWNTPVVGEALLNAALRALRQHRVTRLESSCMSMASTPLIPVFEGAGFQTYWREFLRLELRQAFLPESRNAQVQIVPWQEQGMYQDAMVMELAYDNTVDVDLNTLYRSSAGCQSVLDNLVHQGSCGRLVAEACGRARVRGDVAGFVLVTEISPRQGHLAQVAVSPAYQGQGIGRALLRYCLAQLASLQFHTLSLIVSRANTRALRLYRAMGMNEVLAFPVFVWEQ